jgi:hypothetical protein
MGIFKKSIGHSKSSNLDEKIKILDNELKKTDVYVNENDRNFLHEQKDREEVEKYNWREGLVQSNNENINEEYVREEYRKKNIRRVDSYINSVNEDYEVLKRQIFNEISENFLFNIPSVENKINRVLEIYDEIKEGLLNEPPNIKNKDPLTPLDQNFVTVDELNKHYSLFINRIQEQIATIGGGGETQLKYLDDIVGIATNASAYDNKYLKYDHSLKKFVFETAFGGEQGIQGLQGTQGLLGHQGSQGVQGTFGSQGVQGIQGEFGTQGTQGTQGLQGDIGFQGVQGIQGGLSDQGTQGTQGLQGDVGFQGAQGIQGGLSDQGTQGLQGNVGFQGAQGAQGIQGGLSDQGTQGLQGDVGFQGAQGIQGGLSDQGTQGLQGNVGFQGAQGIQGGLSDQGTQGTWGDQGTQGVQGLSDQGTQGVQGLSNQGTQGLQGVSNQGAQGLQGLSNQGTQGLQGVSNQGAQGLQGLSNQGTQGVQGTTSSFGSRLVVSGTTGSIAAGATTNLDIAGYKSYSLLKVGTSAAAWIVVYSDATSRTNDSTRNYLTDPTPGSGIIAEVRTTTSGSSTFLITPGIVGWNNESPVTSTIYTRVTNNEASSTPITVDLTVVKLEE